MAQSFDDLSSAVAKAKQAVAALPRADIAKAVIDAADSDGFQSAMHTFALAADTLPAGDPLKGVASNIVNIVKASLSQIASDPAAKPAL